MHRSVRWEFKVRWEPNAACGTAVYGLRPAIGQWTQLKSCWASPYKPLTVMEARLSICRYGSHQISRLVGDVMVAPPLSSLDDIDAVFNSLTRIELVSI